MRESCLRRSRSPRRVICFCLFSVVTLVAAYTGLLSGGRAAVRALERGPATGGSGPPGFVASQAWMQPRPVADGVSRARYPRMVRNPANGDLHLTWEEDGQRVRYAYRSVEGWTVSPYAWQGYAPAIALDGRGTPHIVYAAETDTSGRTQILHRAAAEGWLPTDISDTHGNSQRPQISLLVDEQIHVAWVETLDAVDRVYHAISDDGGATWPELRPVALGTSPSLDAGGDQVWLAWQGAPQSQTTSLKGDPASDIYVSQWQPAPDPSLAGEGDWSRAENVSQSFEMGSYAPHIASGEGGKTYLVWEEVALDGASSAVAMAWRDGQGWREPIPLSEGEGFASSPQISAGVDGQMGIAWDAGTSLRMRQGGMDTWSADQTIVTHDSGVADACLLSDDTGLWQAVFSVRLVTKDTSLWLLYQAAQAPFDTVTPPASETPTPTTTASATTTPSGTPTTMATATTTIEATLPIPSVTPSVQQTLPTPSATATAQASPTNTSSGAGTPTLTATATLTPTASPTATRIPTVEPTLPTPTKTAPVAQTPWAYLALMIKDPGSADNPIPVSVERAPDRNRPDTPTLNAKAELSAEDPGPDWEWYLPTNVSSPSAPGAGSGVDDSDLVVLANGTICAVWSALISGYPVLHYALCENGQWSQPSSFYMGEEPDLAVGPSGQLALVFSGELGGSYDVYYAEWEGDGWSWPDNVSQTSGNATQPALSIAPSGDTVVVWSDNTEGLSRIYYGWRVGALWNTFYVPSSSGGLAPDLSYDSSNRLWACWQSERSSGRYDVFCLYGSDQSWLPWAINISDSAGADSMSPRLAGINDLAAYVVWQEGATGEVRYADTVEHDVWWSLPQALSTQPASQPEIAAQGLGAESHIYVAWDEGASLAFRRKGFSAESWQEGTLVADAGAASLGGVGLTTGPTLGAHASWQQSTALGGNGDADLLYRGGAPLLDSILWTPLVSTP